LGGGSALALVVTTTPEPLPGSQFQGGDGNQDDTATLIDWQGLQADERVQHTSDPNAEDNVFAGGAKEGEPGKWSFAIDKGGAVPASGNILDSYSAVDRPPGGDVFVYLAFTREANNGSVFASFELNQDPRLWTNSKGARIPCRKTGDILITFDPHGTGTEVLAERWVTDQTDPATGCATVGHIQSDASLTPEVVQAAFNDESSITNYLPGSYAGTIPQLNFGEGANNLSLVLQAFGQSCTVFASTWMHSRSSSSSETAGLKDYVAPRPLRLDTCNALPILSSSASGSVNRRARGPHRAVRHRRLRASSSAGAAIYDTAHLSGGAQPTGTLTFKLYGPNDANCAGPPVFTFTSVVIGNGDYRSGE
jgi:hypothetical protein